MAGTAASDNQIEKCRKQTKDRDAMHSYFIVIGGLIDLFVRPSCCFCEGEMWKMYVEGKIVIWNIKWTHKQVEDVLRSFT